MVAESPEVSDGFVKLRLVLRESSDDLVMEESVVGVLFCCCVELLEEKVLCRFGSGAVDVGILVIRHNAKIANPYGEDRLVEFVFPDEVAFLNLVDRVSRKGVGQDMA